VTTPLLDKKALNPAAGTANKKIRSIANGALPSKTLEKSASSASEGGAGVVDPGPRLCQPCV
jgi:hypothetical protein